MFSDIASLRARPLSVNWRMRAIRLQYSVSHEAFFVARIHISIRHPVQTGHRNKGAPRPIALRHGTRDCVAGHRRRVE
jgi:hypothetical protein